MVREDQPRFALQLPNQLLNQIYHDKEVESNHTSADMVIAVFRALREPFSRSL